MCMYIYIYITRVFWSSDTANLPNEVMDFRGFDASIVLIFRGGILLSIGNFPESLGQAILAGRFLLGRLGASLAVGVLRSQGRMEFVAVMDSDVRPTNRYCRSWHIDKVDA